MLKHRAVAVAVVALALGAIEAAASAQALPQNTPSGPADLETELTPRQRYYLRERAVLKNVQLRAAGGYSSGLVHHPEFTQQVFTGPMLDVELSYLLDEHWIVGFGAVALTMPVTLLSVDRYARRGSGEASASTRSADTPARVAYAANSGGTVAPGGGPPVAAAFQIFAGGPRVEYMPIGTSGPFIGFMAGAGTMELSHHVLGVAVGSRVGYRYTWAGHLLLGAGLALNAVFAVERSAHASLPSAFAEVGFR